MKAILWKIGFILAAICFAIVLVCHVILIFKCKSQQITIKEKSDSLYMCQHAPTTTTITTVTTTVKPKDTLHPVPISHTHYVKPKPVTDSTHGGVAHVDTTYDDCDSIQDSYYKDTYTKIDGKDTLSIQWSSHVWGEIDWIKFDAITYPKVYIHTVKTVLVTAPKVYFPRTHYGAYIDVFGKDLKNMPGGGLGMFVSIQDKVGIRAGVDYNTMHSELYGRVGLDIIFK